MSIVQFTHAVPSVPHDVSRASLTTHFPLVSQHAPLHGDVGEQLFEHVPPGPAGVHAFPVLQPVQA